MIEHRAELLNAIVDFQKQETSIDWTEIHTHEAAFEAIQEANEVITNYITFATEISQAERETIAGKLAIGLSKLAFYFGNPDKLKEFTQAGQEYEQALREFTTCSDWLEVAAERFKAFEEFNAKVEKGHEVTEKELLFFSPLLSAIALVTIIGINDEIALMDEMEDEDADFEFEDDECDDEECDDEECDDACDDE